MNILVTAHPFNRHYYLGLHKDYVIDFVIWMVVSMQINTLVLHSCIVTPGLSLLFGLWYKQELSKFKYSEYYYYHSSHSLLWCDHIQHMSYIVTTCLSWFFK